MRTPRKGLSPLRGVLLEGIETQYIRIKAQDAYYGMKAQDAYYGMSKGNA